LEAALATLHSIIRRKNPIANHPTGLEITSNPLSA
jgi:hypothetical protein